MSWNPSQKSPIISSAVDINCIICLEKIVPEDKTPCEGEKPRVLDCSHIFHRECIGSWLVKKNNCPLCRTIIKVDTPEARPDLQQPSFVEEDIEGFLFVIRQNILQTRSLRLLNLNENTVEATTSRKVNSLALSFFKRFQ